MKRETPQSKVPFHPLGIFNPCESMISDLTKKLVLPVPDEAILTKSRKLHFVSTPDRGILRPGGRGSCPCERSATRVSPNPGDQTRPKSEKMKIFVLFLLIEFFQIGFIFFINESKGRRVYSICS